MYKKIIALIVCTSIMCVFKTPVESTEVIPTKAETTHEMEVTEVELPTVTTTLDVYYNIPLSYDLQREIVAIADRYDLDLDIIYAMIYVESGFDINAVGDHGEAIGLMQIQPRWSWQYMAGLGIDEVVDPVANVEVGCYILYDFYSQYGSYEEALCRYNSGRAQNCAGYEYASKVLEYAEVLRNE